MLSAKSPLLSYPIPISERITALYAEYGVLEMDGHAVVLRQGDAKTHFPVGATTLICIEPGTMVTHAAVKACAQSGCLLLWVGEGGVRCYSAGQPGGAYSTRKGSPATCKGSCSRFDRAPLSGDDLERRPSKSGMRSRATNASQFAYLLQRLNQALSWQVTVKICALLVIILEFNWFCTKLYILKRS